jgi:arylsulfatase
MAGSSANERDWHPKGWTPNSGNRIREMIPTLRAVVRCPPFRVPVLLAVILCCFSHFILAAPAPASAPLQPDILLIMPDQWRGDCLGIRGHPVVRTPTIDALAREGALFVRAYSTCPSCIPARFSLLTGLYPSTSGVVGFKATPIHHPTLPKLLDDAGYTTALIGRCMHQTPDNESYGYQTEIRGSTYVNGDDYDQFLRKAAPETEGIRSLMQKAGVTANGWEAKPWPLAEDLHPTAWTVRESRQFLRSAPVEKPLFLTTSFFSPHPPLFPPARFFSYYEKQKLPAPAHGDWVSWGALTTKGDKNGHRVLLEGDTLKATLSGYFGLIEWLDEQVAPLIADFKQRSRKAGRPWLIIFTTDHGEMLGDHGYFRKCEPYEGSANIPLIIAGSPELGLKPGLRLEQPVCLEDIMPTMLASAGAQCPEPIDGVNLAPTLRGEKQTIRQTLLFEHAVCYSREQAFLALTDGRFKYIWRPVDGSEHLFDLNRDPKEEHDLARTTPPSLDLTSWRSRLIRLLANRPEGFSDGQKLIAGRPYPPLEAKASR